MSHKCHAIKCNVRVSPTIHMCYKHWKSLPKKIRDDIWKYYRKGQEVDKKPSPEYLDSIDKSIKFIYEKEGRG